MYQLWQVPILWSPLQHAVLVQIVQLGLSAHHQANAQQDHAAAMFTLTSGPTLQTLLANKTIKPANKSKALEMVITKLQASKLTIFSLDAAILARDSACQAWMDQATHPTTALSNLLEFTFLPQTLLLLRFINVK